MDCKSANDHLMDYLYQELEPGLMDQLEQHLQGCSTCADEVSAFESTRQATRLMPDEEPPAAMTRLLLEEAARAVQPVPEPAGFWEQLRAGLRMFALHPAMTAAAMLMLVVGVSFFAYRKTDPPAFEEAHRGMPRMIRPSSELKAIPAPGAATATIERTKETSLAPDPAPAPTKQGNLATEEANPMARKVQLATPMEDREEREGERNLAARDRAQELSGYNQAVDTNQRRQQMDLPAVSQRATEPPADTRSAPGRSTVAETLKKLRAPLKRKRKRRARAPSRPRAADLDDLMEPMGGEGRKNAVASHKDVARPKTQTAEPEPAPLPVAKPMIRGGFKARSKPAARTRPRRVKRYSYEGDALNNLVQNSAKSGSSSSFGSSMGAGMASKADQARSTGKARKTRRARRTDKAPRHYLGISSGKKGGRQASQQRSAPQQPAPQQPAPVKTLAPPKAPQSNAPVADLQDESPQGQQQTRGKQAQAPQNSKAKDEGTAQQTTMKLLAMGTKYAQAGQCDKGMYFLNRALSRDPDLTDEVTPLARRCAAVFARQGQQKVRLAQKSYRRLSYILEQAWQQESTARAEKVQFDDAKVNKKATASKRARAKAAKKAPPKAPAKAAPRKAPARAPAKK